MISKKEVDRANKRNLLRRFKSNIFEAIMKEISNYDHLFEDQGYSLRDFIKVIEEIPKIMENMIKNE